MRARTGRERAQHPEDWIGSFSSWTILVEGRATRDRTIDRATMSSLLVWCALLQTLLLVTLRLGDCAIAVDANRTSALEEARLQRENLVRKYLKRLKKEEGALKLIGGRGDFEGECYGMG